MSVDRMPNREHVNTSLRVERELLDRFREVVNAEDADELAARRRGPRSRVGDDLRKYMQRRVDEADAA